MIIGLMMALSDVCRLLWKQHIFLLVLDSTECFRVVVAVFAEVSLLLLLSMMKRHWQQDVVVVRPRGPRAAAVVMGHPSKMVRFVVVVDSS